jgi:hypothetical protein
MAGSPSSTISSVYYTFKLRNKRNHADYCGTIKLGEKNRSITYSDDNVSQEVIKWISSIRFSKPCVGQMIIEIDIPENQKFIIPLHVEKFIIVDLSTILGVSYQEICREKFEVIDANVFVDTVPFNATKI